jgi:hypothetical protein
MAFSIGYSVSILVLPAWLCRSVWKRSGAEMIAPMALGAAFQSLPSWPRLIAKRGPAAQMLCASSATRGIVWK